MALRCVHYARALERVELQQLAIFYVYVLVYLPIYSLSVWAQTTRQRHREKKRSGKQSEVTTILSTRALHCAVCHGGNTATVEVIYRIFKPLLLLCV